MVKEILLSLTVMVAMTAFCAGCGMVTHNLIADRARQVF